MNTQNHVQIIKDSIKIWGTHPEALERIKELEGRPFRNFTKKPLVWIFKKKKFNKPKTYKEYLRDNG